MKNYQKPEFKFEDLYMFDGIANTCWGYGHVEIRVYKDENGNKKYDDGELIYFDENYTYADNGHCNAVAQKVNEDLANVAEEYKKYLVSVSGNTNSKSLADSAVQDFIKS